MKQIHTKFMIAQVGGPQQQYAPWWLGKLSNFCIQSFKFIQFIDTCVLLGSKPTRLEVAKGEKHKNYAEPTAAMGEQSAQGQRMTKTK